jgi:hypothetical protein
MAKGVNSKNINVKISDEVFGLTSVAPGIFKRFTKLHWDFLTDEHPNFKINFSHRGRERRFSYLIKRKTNGLTVTLENEQLLRKSLDTKNLEVYAHKTFDLENFFRILLSYYLSENEGLFLHASCIEHKGLAHLFCGPSGAGKSTIAGLAGKRLVLSDDLILIRRINKDYRAFATPFGLHSSNIANINLSIKALYLLRQARRIRLQKHPYRETLAKLVSNLVFLGNPVLQFDRLFDRLLVNSHNFLKQIPCYNLDFSINHNLWRYL